MKPYALVLLWALAGCTGGDAQTIKDAAPPQTVQAKARPAVANARRTAITDAVSRVSPSVVTIQTEVIERSQDPFDGFFGGAAQQKVPGLGTGFVIRSDGVIITNAHVVAGASHVAVALRDGTSYTAKVLGVDEVNDLAVVKIPATGLPVAPLGESDDLLIGEWAIAIGNPYGFYLGNPEPSVTVGVVSGVGRNLVGQSEGGGVYVDMIQTDAAINPGNSGGPLVDALGEVIGVNSSIYTPSGGSVGLGFAIPINRAKRVADDLLANGSVRRPWVGIKLKLPETNNPRDALNSGVVVRTVVPGSPAATAGIQPGDVLEKAGTRTLRNPYDWEGLLLDLRVGQTVPLTVKRGTREFPVTVTIGDLPEVSAPKVEVLRELELVTLTPTIRSERSVRSEHGAVIYKLSDRVGEDLGIQTGDVIVQINRTPITSADEAAKALNYYGGRGPIRMFFERNGQVFSTDFSIQ
jgi:serine protease Do